MSTQSSTRSGGISTLGLLGVLFVGLKLTGYITWSWWLVLLPFWFGLAVILFLIAGVGVLAAFCGALIGIATVIDKMLEPRRAAKRLAARHARENRIGR